MMHDDFGHINTPSQNEPYNFCRNPTLAKYGGEAQHLEKLEVASLPRLLNV